MTLQEKLKYDRDKDKLRTPVPGCPSCITKSVHTKEDWEKYHPERGTGSQSTYSIKGERKE